MLSLDMGPTLFSRNFPTFFHRAKNQCARRNFFVHQFHEFFEKLTYVIFRHWGWHPFFSTNSPRDVWHRVLYVWDAKGLVIQKILQFLLIQGGLRLRSKKCVIEFCVQNSSCGVFNRLNFSNLSIHHN